MSIFIPGLVSITFRKLSPSEILELASRAGLRQMEWGGDVHVPPGDLDRAREVARQTREAGLECAAYGSYYRLGAREEAGLSFADVLETARALNAPTIRVWAGTKGSAELDTDERKRIVDDAWRSSSLARGQGVTVSLEYHAGTLCDTRSSVAQLIRELSGSGVEFLWQPVTGESPEENEARLRDVLPFLRHIHVFHWWPTVPDRLPLVDGEKAWKGYLRLIRETGKTIPCLMEFVRDDSPEQLLQDAATLRRWLSGME